MGRGLTVVKSTATAHPNIALVKYWGKRDDALILPHQSSLSVTLAPLSVTTTVEWGRGEDQVHLNGEPARGSEATWVIERVRPIARESEGAPPSLAA